MKLIVLLTSLCALSMGVGCGAEGAQGEPSEEEQLRSWFEEQGFDATTLEIEGSEITVEGDIGFRREYVLEQIRRAAEADRQGNATGAPATLRPQGYWFAQGGFQILPVNVFPICYLNELTGDMSAALKVAAKEWSQAADSPADRTWGVSTDTHIQIVVSTTCAGFGPNSIVRAYTDSFQGAGKGDFPEYVNLDPVIRPGTYLKLHYDYIRWQTYEHILEVVLHEMGHNLGFMHPGRYSHIADTETTPTDGFDPNSMIEPTPAYSTVMRSDALWSDTPFLFPDDKRSAAVMYRRKPSECPVFDRNAPLTENCSAACPCSVGVGDCDFEGSGTECKSGLICGTDNGPKYGLPTGFEVCVKPNSCPVFNPNSPSTTFCEDPACPCGFGEGDCEEEECGGYLVCGKDNGAAVGLAPGWEVCKLPRGIKGVCADWSNETAHESSCAECPCGLGEGDCDNNSQCQPGLVCAKDVGPQFGFPSEWDMCVLPGIFSNTY
jgi:hypothetical protein